MDDTTRDAIRTATSLIDLATATVRDLKRRGDTATGRCPFHDDRTPSLSLNDRDGVWYCHGCHAGGDVFTWVKQRDNVGFSEAAATLAAAAGITIEQPDRNDRPRQRHAAAVQTWLEMQLFDHADSPIGVLFDRGYTLPELELWGWGWWPPGQHPPVPRDQINELGIMSGRRPLLAGRLTVPYRTRDGHPATWSGRHVPGVTAGDGPKWVNGQERPWYKKSRFVYGLDVSAQAAVNDGQLHLVEGPSDVHAMWRAGFPAVATCGTSVTEHHLRLAARYSRRLVAVFDADNAGRDAAVRFATRLPADTTGTVAELGDGDDPDSATVEQVVAAVAAARPSVEWAVRYRLGDSDPLSDGWAKRVRTVHELVSDVTDPVAVPVWKALIEQVTDVTVPDRTRTARTARASAATGVDDLEFAAARVWAATFPGVPHPAGLFTGRLRDAVTSAATGWCRVAVDDPAGVSVLTEWCRLRVVAASAAFPSAAVDLSRLLHSGDIRSLAAALETLAVTARSDAG